MSEVVEGTAEEVELEVAYHQNLALFGTSDPVGVVEQATRVADALADVIRAKGLYSMIGGKAHVRVEGWQLLGSMLGVTAVCTATEQVEGGYLATVDARAANGRVVGRADAVCTRAERRWKNADEYALLSMAQTRATAKALKGPLGFVVSLAGYQTTPAEEMTFAEPDPQPEPEPQAQEDAMSEAEIDEIAKLYGASGWTFERLCTAIGSVGGDAPKINRPDSIRVAMRALTCKQGLALADALDAAVSTQEVTA